MSSQTKTNNLNYLMDPKLSKVNILSILSIENENDRVSFLKYYTPSVEIKHFNVLMVNVLLMWQ